MKLGKEIGIESFGIVGNKIQDNKQKNWIQSQFPADQTLGMIPYDEIIQNADLNEQPLIELLDERLRTEFNNIYAACKPSL